MNRIIRLIWDFRGADSEKTANHHLIHLVEFSEREKIHFHHKGVESTSSVWHSAFVDVDESIVFTLRDVLKPHRAEIVD